MKYYEPWMTGSGSALGTELSLHTGTIQHFSQLPLKWTNLELVVTLQLRVEGQKEAGESKWRSFDSGGLG